MIKATKWFTLISGLLIVVLGVIMLFTPLEDLVALAVFIAVGMLISGIAEIAAFCGEETGKRSGWLLTGGILSTLFGVWAMFGYGTEALASSLPFIFAVWVMTSGIIRIVGSVSLKSEHFSMWGWLLAFGILGTIFGFLLQFTPLLSAVVASVSIAIILISYGINNIIIFCRMNKLGKAVHNRIE